MNICFNCKGKLYKTIGSVTIEGVTIAEIPYQECTQCHEQFFDERTSIFLQRIVNFVNSQRKELMEEALA